MPIFSLKNLSQTALQALICFGIFSSTQADDWLQYGGGNRNFSIKPVAQETIANFWRVPIAGGDAAAVVHQDRIVVSAIDFASDGTDAHLVTCLERVSGKILWEQVLPENSFGSQDISDRYPVRPMSTPCIVGQQVIVCGFGGSVRSLDLRNGSQNWYVDLVKQYGSSPIQYGYACSPWSDGEQVVVACGGDQALLLSLNLNDGTMHWKCGTGMASYASPILMLEADGIKSESRKQLVYAAGDEAIGVEPKSGKVLWQYQYPTPGLTNAVTPIAVAPSKLLLGGQGVSGTRLISIQKNENGYAASEVWHNSKLSPFYCNWLQLTSNPKCVVGFMGKTLIALDWTTGDIYWQKRGWADSNLVSLDDQLLVVRGDGFVGLVSSNEKGPELIAGDNTIKDRVWAPATVVDQQILLVGRSGLVSLPIKQLQTITEVPIGNEVTSMESMYGSRPERIQQLIEQSKKGGKFTIEEYLSIASDKTLQLSDGDFTAIINNLLQSEEVSLALTIATSRVEQAPQSIPAWDRYVDLLRISGKEEQADMEVKARLVDVRIEITAPSTIPAQSNIYMMGNAKSIGAWKPNGVQFQPTGDGRYVATCQLPRGDFQFKFTCGSTENVEVRSDARNISNRHHRIAGPTTLIATVQAWKM